MAWVKDITGWIANWSSDGSNVTFPIASVPELTAAEADVTTGDIRKFLYAFCEMCWQKWNSLVTADKSVNMVMTKNSFINTSTGITTHTYTFTFQNVTTAQEVADEP